jgi:hypothetical protein
LSSATVNGPDAAALGRIDFQSDPAHVPPGRPDPTVPIPFCLSPWDLLEKY